MIPPLCSRYRPLAVIVSWGEEGWTRAPSPAARGAIGLAPLGRTVIKRMTSDRLALDLALFLAGAGALHFLAPRPYDSIVPRVLPGKPRHYTYASGAAELGCAALVAIPQTRRLGAEGALALFAARTGFEQDLHGNLNYGYEH